MRCPLKDLVVQVLLETWGLGHPTDEVGPETGVVGAGRIEMAVLQAVRTLFLAGLGFPEELQCDELHGELFGVVEVDDRSLDDVHPLHWHLRPMRLKACEHFAHLRADLRGPSQIGVDHLSSCFHFTLSLADPRELHRRSPKNAPAWLVKLLTLGALIIRLECSDVKLV